MKKLLLAAVLMLPMVVYGHHPPPTEGKVYQFPPTALCKNAQGVVQFQELLIENGLSGAKRYLDTLVRAGECAIFCGGGLKYLETVQTDRHDGYVWRVLKVGTADGKEYYTMFGWKDHRSEV